MTKLCIYAPPQKSKRLINLGRLFLLEICSRLDGEPSMRLALALCVIASSAVADSSSLSLALPSPPMNYQSDSFSTGSMRCSNAVGGGVNLEYGVTGVLSGLNTNSRGKDIGVYARIVIPLR